MKKQNLILSAALAAVFSASTAFAEAEVTGKIIHESGFFSEAGSTIGNRGNATTTGVGSSSTPMSTMGSATGAYRGVTTAATPAHKKNDVFKSETIAKLYIDGEVDEIAEGSTYHIELQGYTNGDATSNYDSNEDYTQRDMLREAYVDLQQGDWSIRAGKQQVVWGTADGMKLLDAINPTDYAEMAQNQMEDSRVPVWMFNAETTQEDGSELQVVVSQAKENTFVGLNRGIDTGVRANDATYLDDTTLNNGTDTGNAFMMKGPDSIAGGYNGFLNIVPDLGSVATRFGSAFSPASGTVAVGGASELIVTDLATGAYTIGGDAVTMDAAGDTLINNFNAGIAAGGRGNLGGAGMEGFVVGKSSDTAGTTFAVMTMTQMDAALNPGSASPTTLGNIPPGFRKAILDTWANLGGTASAVSTAVGYTVTGIGDLTGATMLDAGFQPLYNSNLSSFGDNTADSAFEYMDTTTFRTFDAFVNAKSQYVYNMPSDSDVDLAMRYKNSSADGVNYSLNASYNYDKNPIIDLSWRGDAGQKLTVHEVKTGYTSVGARQAVDGTQAYSRTTLQLVDVPNATQLAADSANDAGFYNTTAGGVYSGATGSAGAATLQFSQEVKRVKQIGGSFDTAIETAELGPVVIRGEALYTKDGYSPVMNKDKLSYGDLVGALQMVKADRFKLVLGADITAMTNMMISAQFIQDSNLDFVDNGNNYTTDYATMHLSNGFNKAIKDKNFYSLFFSKPFGASGEHRWNNITMLEEGVGGNGKWNRLDAEFSIDDDTQATVEYNKYWGDANTQFGQLEKSSNIQVGVKYSF
jgi:hypothetical protein